MLIALDDCGWRLLQLCIGGCTGPLTAGAILRQSEKAKRQYADSNCVCSVLPRWREYELANCEHEDKQGTKPNIHEEALSGL
jgi:hypothetical protein